ncbi:MAG TPA: YCF48-related protein [Methylibium sp.]|nr:YCF48-related protein [Methylibium sp.]
MNHGLRTLALLLSAFVAYGLPAAATAFADRLDTPALPSPLAQRGLLNGMARAGERLVAVGERGHILWSDDLGATWLQAHVPVSVDLTAVYFPSALRGWAVGHDGVVLATRDGGRHWERQLDGRLAVQLMQTHYAAHPPPDISPEAMAALQADVARMVEEGADKPFLDVWFENDSTGYVVGLFNLIFRTTDGGTTWQPLFDRTDNPQRLHLYAVRPAAGGLYVAGEQGLVLKFDPATQRFKALSVAYRGTFFGITAADDAVLVYGLRGHVFRSEDGGAHWQQVPTGVSVAITSATQLADGRTVLAGQDGQVLASTDGGRSFAPLARAARPVSSIARAGATALAVAGPRGVLSLSLASVVK